MVILIDIPTGGLAQDIGGLQNVLNTVYNTLFVHCSDLIQLAQGIAAFASLWYFGAHCWPSISENEPIKIYPLFRPFATSLVIGMFPAFLALLNGVMEPTVAGTSALVGDSNQAITTLLEQKQDALKYSNEWQMYINKEGGGNLDKWESLSGEADSGMFSGISNRIKFEMAKASYNVKSSVKLWLSEVLETLFESASLCINTIRIFFLIVMSILGPLTFAFSIIPGLSNSVLDWLAYYLHVFLWLPVSNILGYLIGQIQAEMIRIDINQLNNTGHTSFSQTDAAYIIFLILAIASYCTVPTITNHIIKAANKGVQSIKLPRNMVPTVISK